MLERIEGISQPSSQESQGKTPGNLWRQLVIVWHFQIPRRGAGVPARTAPRKSRAIPVNPARAAVGDMPDREPEPPCIRLFAFSISGPVGGRSL